METFIHNWIPFEETRSLPLPSASSSRRSSASQAGRVLLFLVESRMWSKRLCYLNDSKYGGGYSKCFSWTIFVVLKAASFFNSTKTRITHFLFSCWVLDSILTQDGTQSISSTTVVLAGRKVSKVRPASRQRKNARRKTGVFLASMWDDVFYMS